MISELFSSLAAPVFAAMLLLFFLKRRSREINRREANNDAAANDGTAGGDSGAHSPTGVPEMATSSGPAKDAAASDGTAGCDSGAYPSTEGDGTATSSRCDYEVFLSFRGPDTRSTFTNYLYTRLKDAGIRVFKDDEDLRKGEEFGPELLRAIKQSKVLVPIFSKGYATSVWCLKEVVQMVECQARGQKIVPIFYDVAPAEVRYQTGGYEKAFRLHDSKNRYDQKTIGEWKAALSAVGAVHGWDLHKEGENRREGEFVKTFAHKVFNELKKASLAVSDYLVSVDDQVDEIMEKIGDGTSETRIIGIHGMGGIGKTTIAKIIFNKFADDFKDRCFLHDIRETSKTSGIQCLQMKLISSLLKEECTDIKDVHEGKREIKNRLSNKRVLLLLDDVEDSNHIDALVCKHDWLGKGSKIIVTSRRRDVLYVQDVDDCYELKGMDPDQSLQLFSKHAFRRDSPLDEYIDLSNRAIDIAAGLPLALEVIGSLLSRTKKEKWDAQLNKLANVPAAEVQRRLSISYDALEDREKHIFLDIACLFIGYDKDILVHFWESTFFPEEAMEVLQNMSLIKITEDNKVWMHDHLRDLGREKVREKSDMEEEKQRRVWDPKVGLDLLMKHKEKKQEKKEVQALRLKLEHPSSCHFTYEGFENLSNLRFLEADCSTENFQVEERLLWHELPSDVPPTNENSDLFPKLRWLSWHHFPPTFNIANFIVEDLVILNLSRSKITYDWKGWSHMKVMKNLKVLNLSKCRNLQRLPDELGSYLVSLECLSLEDCVWLERLPNSIEDLESLIELDISGTRIEELPDSIGKLKNLKRLKMQKCDISKISNALWTIEKLEEIEVSNKNIKDFHVNIGNCISKNQSLRILKLDDADIQALPRLPESLVTLHLDSLKMDTFPDLSNLTNLKDLDLSFESHDSSDGVVENPIPRWMGNLSKLESLHLVCPCVTTSPTDLTLPPQLKSLCLECPNLRRLPRLPQSLSSFYLYNCRSLCSMESLDLSLPYVTTSPTDLTLPSHLKELHLSDCTNLRCLPRLPSSLFSLYLYECESLYSMEDLSNLKNLSSLLIRDSAIEEIQGLGCLENLRDLKLFSLKEVKVLPDLSSLNTLRCLEVKDCGNLVEIQGALPRFLDKLHISSCDSLQNLPHLSSLVGELEVEIWDCSKLNAEAILGFATDTQLSTLEQLRVLSVRSDSRRLEIRDYHGLIEIQGELPQSVEVLVIDSCESLLKLPDLSSLKELREVSIIGCKELKGDAILGSASGTQANLWENLQYLRFCSLEKLEILPDLSILNKLRCLQIQSCANLFVIDGEFPGCLEELEISSCTNLQELPSLSSLKELREVSIIGCKELKGDAILGSASGSQANLWENLQYLRFCSLEKLEILPDLSILNKLRCLQIQSCANLFVIDGEFLGCLEELEISSCTNLQELPSLSSLNGLREVKIYGCSELNVEAISSICSEKSIIFLGDEQDREDTKYEYEYESDEGEEE